MKLPKVLQKVFGFNQDPSRLKVIGSLADGTPTTATDIQEVQNNPRYLGGWPDCVIGENAHAIEDRGSLDYLITHQLKYIFQNGIPEHNNEETYYKNAIVSHNGEIRRLKEVIATGPFNEFDWDYVYKNIPNYNTLYEFAKESSGAGRPLCQPSARGYLRGGLKLAGTFYASLFKEGRTLVSGGLTNNGIVTSLDLKINDVDNILVIEATGTGIGQGSTFYALNEFDNFETIGNIDFVSVIATKTSIDKKMAMMIAFSSTSVHALVLDGDTLNSYTLDDSQLASESADAVVNVWYSKDFVVLFSNASDNNFYLAKYSYDIGADAYTQTSKVNVGAYNNSNLQSTSSLTMFANNRLAFAGSTNGLYQNVIVYQDEALDWKVFEFEFPESGVHLNALDTMIVSIDYRPKTNRIIVMTRQPLSDDADDIDGVLYESNVANELTFKRIAFLEGLGEKAYVKFDDDDNIFISDGKTGTETIYSNKNFFIL